MGLLSEFASFGRQVLTPFSVVPMAVPTIFASFGHRVLAPFSGTHGLPSDSPLLDEVESSRVGSLAMFRPSRSTMPLNNSGGTYPGGLLSYLGRGSFAMFFPFFVWDAYYHMFVRRFPL